MQRTRIKCLNHHTKNVYRMNREKTEEKKIKSREKRTVRKAV